MSLPKALSLRKYGPIGALSTNYLYLCENSADMSEDVATRLKSKIEELISRYEAVRSENKELKERLEQAVAQNDIKTQKLNRLEKQIENLQLKKAFTDTSGDNTQAKRKVVSLIKEIDKCMELLNN